MFFLGSLLATAVVTVALYAYTIVVFGLGRAFARIDPVQPPPRIGALALAVLWIAPSMLAWLLPLVPVMKLAAALAFYVLHAQPFCFGYLAERLLRIRTAERRWSKNADDWLAEWECRPAESLGERWPSS